MSSVGADLDVQCAVSGAPAPATTAAPSAAPAAPPPPSYDGFAPGDEEEPVDPDAPAAPGTELRGEDAALALVQSELGGKVMETRGE